MPSDAGDDDRSPPFRVVVVGGGTAGWLTAARIAASNPAGTGNVSVTLVESAAIAPVGVGEGTWPTMRNTLARIGIAEADFISAADATFKQGAKFVGWTDGSAADAYYHPLNPPAGAGEIDLGAHWQAHDKGRDSDFAHSVDFQAALCDAGLAPKAITSPQFRGIANYAYHLDAAKFAILLKDHAVGQLGVEHIVDDVADVDQNEDGDVVRLKCASGREIEGDFFVDCSGFRARLIGQVYGVPLIDRSTILFPNRALAMQVPYDADDAPIACQTISTAQDAGWIWDIGLWSRRGVGYVYSNAHTSDEAAEDTLRRYVGPRARGLNCRRLDINAGQRRSFWQNNCVAIGLSSGFLEPLEASSLVLVEVALNAIADRLPRSRSAMKVAAKQFNAAFDHHWDRVIEFLKLHYVLTQRTDTAFWRDNLEPSSIPDSLQERLAMWRDVSPGVQDFAHSPEVFSWPSYQYVIHGMRYPTRYGRSPRTAAGQAAERQWLDRAATARVQALAQMPSHRDLIRAVREHGLQRI
ncbi:tryptophan 7-halogenase [Sphingomonas koreensis]|nr:tryptophan 7-halogenase [Sphingomonas koreensis]